MGLKPGVQSWINSYNLMIMIYTVVKKNKKDVIISDNKEKALNKF